MKISSMLGAGVIALMATTAFADPGSLAIWGGGKKGASTYTDVYVPAVISALESQALEDILAKTQKS